MALCFADFEFTCGGRIVREEVELLSVGLVFCDDNAERVIDTFYDTVLPIRHPKLTKQCTKLTGLSQQTIDASFDAQYICGRANDALMKYSCDKIYVWGNYDTVGLSSTAGIYDRYALECDEIRHTCSLIEDIQKSVMNRFGTNDIINVGDLSRALDFEPDGRFHNALVDAQALYCIYSHSLHPDVGCEKVYKLLSEREQIKKARELEQKAAHEDHIKSIIEGMTGAEKELYTSLISEGRTKDADRLVKLHLTVDKQYSKISENSDVVAVCFNGTGRVSVFEQSRFITPKNADITYKSYPYGDKERLILESFASKTAASKKRTHRRRRLRSGIRNKG